MMRTLGHTCTVQVCIIVCVCTYSLTHLCLAVHKMDMGKQWCHRSDATQRGDWSGSTAVTLNTRISTKHGKTKNNQTSLLLEMDIPKVLRWKSPLGAICRSKITKNVSIGNPSHDCHLENIFCASSSELKCQSTLNLIGSFGITSRSKQLKSFRSKIQDGRHGGCFCTSSPEP